MLEDIVCFTLNNLNFPVRLCDALTLNVRMVGYQCACVSLDALAKPISFAG